MACGATRSHVTPVVVTTLGDMVISEPVLDFDLGERLSPTHWEREILFIAESREKKYAPPRRRCASWLGPRFFYIYLIRRPGAALPGTRGPGQTVNKKPSSVCTRCAACSRRPVLPGTCP